MRYRVQIDGRFRYFADREVALQFCEHVFRERGVVLGLEVVKGE